MTIIRLALQSLSSRWFPALLTVLALALSVMLFLGVEKIRNGARASFADTISGTDIVVGARTGGIQLLLYSVFRIGNATNNITWKTYQDIARNRDVKWTVPLSLGDAHRGFRVLGTTTDYFEHYRYRSKQKLTFAQGKRFGDLFDTVIGADVATSLGYKLGDSIVIGHGLGRVSLLKHKDKPFRVVGILSKTGTPVDRTVHVSLEAIEAIHIDWKGGTPNPANRVTVEQVRQMKLKPRAITAVLVGLNSKLRVFRFQRTVNEYKAEPITAILPGVALGELWQLVGQAETALAVVSGMVILTALLGMMTMILTTLNERRREMAILRSVGAGPRTVLGLLVSEAGVLTFAGVLLGTIALYVGLWLARDIIDSAYGIYIPIQPPNQREFLVLGGIVLGGIVAGILPAARAYRQSLSDGMLVRN